MAEALVDVPFCVSGGITVAHPSLCLDGATHLIHTTIVGTIRLVPTNKEVEAVLKKYENKEICVTVCGYARSSPNCTHMEVYYAGPCDEAAPKIKALSGGMDAGGS